jgi:hypothetical protein
MAAGSVALVGRSPSGFPHSEGTLYPAPASIEHMGEIECIDESTARRSALYGRNNASAESHHALGQVITSAEEMMYS